MADIKYCPRCGGRPTVIRTKHGFKWIHKCKKTENMKFESLMFEKFGDAVRDWNKRTKYLRDILDHVKEASK